MEPAFNKSAFAKPAFGTFNTAMYDWGQNSNSLESYNIIPVNKWNLIMGQYTKLNLKNVCTVSNGTPPTQHCGNGYNEKPCNPCQNTLPVKIDRRNRRRMEPQSYESKKVGCFLSNIAQYYGKAQQTLMDLESLPQQE